MRMFETEYFATMTTLNERQQVTRKLLTSCYINIQIDFIDGLDINLKNPRLFSGKITSNVRQPDSLDPRLCKTEIS